MPRSNINAKQYKEESLGGWIVGQMYRKKLKRQDLAEELFISKQGLSWKLQNNSFDYGDLLTIFRFLDSTAEEIAYVMTF